MDAALCALQVVDTDLDRCESNRWSRLDPDDGEDMESDEPSYTDQQLYMPLRQVLASLRRLHRLRLRGASPFGLPLRSCLRSGCVTAHLTSALGGNQTDSTRSNLQHACGRTREPVC